MTAFLVGFVVGASVVGIIVIVVGPTRRVRAETGIDGEVETRLLLGLDPEPDVAPVIDLPHPHEYSESDIEGLEALATAPRRTRKRRSQK